MKIAAYILFGLQAFSMYGYISQIGFGNYFVFIFENLFFFNGVPGFSAMIGHFLFTIIGIILLIKSDKKEKEKGLREIEEMAKDPNVKSWVCSKCGTTNLERVKTCQRCGVTKQWSDAQK